MIGQKILMINIKCCQGETQDRRQTRLHWAAPGLDDSSWLPVETAASSGLELVQQTRPRVAAIATHRPISVTKTEDGKSFLVDFGKNVAGVVRLYASAFQRVDGAQVVVRHCEVLNHPPLSDGPRECYYNELVNAESTDRYTLSSSAEQNGAYLEPEFTIHGFRYATITGAASITMDNVERVQISADVPQTGMLHFSDEVFQRIQDATLNSQQSNMQDIPTDCAQVGNVYIQICADAFVSCSVTRDSAGWAMPHWPASRRCIISKVRQRPSTSGST